MDEVAMYRGRPLRIMAWPAFENTTGNPYNRLLYEEMVACGVQVKEFTARQAAAGSHDIWHMHWPDDLLSRRRTVPTAARLAGLRGLMNWKRRRGTRIVWTVHDLGPHESYHPRLERWFWGWFLPEIDGYITLSEFAREAAQETFPALRRVPGYVTPHGHYRSAYPNEIDRDAARGRLGLSRDETMMLHLGRIRPYKNVPHLVGTFSQTDLRNTRLFIVGNPVSDDLRSQIEQAAAEDLRVRLRLEFIPDEDMQVYFNAADLVVLPFRDIVHSGSALLSLSFNCPVVVPTHGAMGELREQVGADWVHTYEGEFTSGVLTAALEWLRRTDRSSPAPLNDLGWDTIARRTLEAYQSILRATEPIHE